MRLIRLALLTAILLAGCDSGARATAAPSECIRIVSALERLACFDAAAGTPPMPVPEAPVATEATPKVPGIRLLVDANEAGRLAEETLSRITRSPDVLPGQDKVVISAPSLAGDQPGTWLAISCLSNISRLQLLSIEPLPVNHIGIRLLLDGRPLTPTRTWQVLDDGTVVDAGRGLVAIEQLRQLTRPGEWLQVESNHAPLHGIRFDARALAEQMPWQREACHW